MRLLRLKIVENGDRVYYYMWCPGCEELHMIDSRWGFDGNIESPTFTPSILTWQGDCPEFPNLNDKRPYKRCHSYVRDGKWEFLSDCTHSLAGQTVPLVDIPTRMRF